jgi:hypothetical protein
MRRLLDHQLNRPSYRASNADGNHNRNGENQEANRVQMTPAGIDRDYDGQRSDGSDQEPSANRPVLGSAGTEVLRLRELGLAAPDSRRIEHDCRDGGCNRSPDGKEKPTQGIHLTTINWMPRRPQETNPRFISGSPHRSPFVVETIVDGVVVSFLMQIP